MNKKFKRSIFKMSAAAVTEESNFHLKWHSHRSTLNEALSSLLASEAFADVTLAVSATDANETSGETSGRSCCFFRAHRVILSACSPYLNRLLSETCSPLWPPKVQPTLSTVVSPPLYSHPLVILPPGIGSSALRILLRFIYTGTADVPHDQLVSVLHAGEILQIRGLCRGENSLDEQDPLDSASPRNTAEDSLAVGKERIIGDLVENVLENGRHSELRIKEVRGSKSNATGQGPNAEESTQREGTRSKSKKILSSKLRRSSSCKEKKTPEESSRPCSAENEENSGEDEIQTITVKQEPIEESDVVEETREDRERSSIAKGGSWWDRDDSQDSLPVQVSSPSIFSPMHVTIKPDIELSNDGETDYVSMGGKSAEVEMLEVDEDDDFGQTMPLTCDFCSETFISAAAWVRHLKTHPPSMLPNDPDPWRHSRKVRQPWRPAGEGASVTHRSHVCPSCSKRFYSNASLLIHIRTHTGERPFECDVCRKGFNVKSNLIRHMRTLHGKIVSPSQVEEKA